MEAQTVDYFVLFRLFPFQELCLCPLSFPTCLGNKHHQSLFMQASPGTSSLICKNVLLFSKAKKRIRECSGFRHRKKFCSKGNSLFLNMNGYDPIAPIRVLQVTCSIVEVTQTFFRLKTRVTNHMYWTNGWMGCKWVRSKARKALQHSLCVLCWHPYLLHMSSLVIYFKLNL